MSAGWVTSGLLSSCVEVGYFGSALPSWTWKKQSWRNTNIIKCDWRNIFLSKRIAAPVHMQSSSCHFDPKTAAPDELEQPFRTPLDSKVQIRGHITTSMSTLCLFPQADLEICLRCAFSCFCHARAIATQ